MQVSVEQTSTLERRMTVSVPSAEINTAVEQRLKKAQKTVQINGFRRGKVPMKILSQRFGDGVRQEVVGEVVNRTYGEALQQEDIRPAGMPQIEPMDDDQGDTFNYTAVFEVYPQVTLGNLADVNVEKALTEVTESDIDEMLETLRNQAATQETVDRSAADGDNVIINYRGSVDGEEFEGGSAENSPLVLGSNSMIPGFESGILGMNAGETRNVEVTFPDDYQAEELRGKDAVFEITLNQVQEKTLPEIDEEFMQRFGVEGGDMEMFRTEVKSNMERELETKAQSYVKNQVMDAVFEMHELELPKNLVAEEVTRSKQEMFQQYGQGIDIDVSQFPDEPFIEQSERRVKLGLVISELVSSAELTADPEKVKEEISKMASSYEESEQVEQYYYSNENLLNSVQMKVLEDQVVDHILAQASVSEVSLSYAELMAKK